MSDNWKLEFRELYQSAQKRYRDGRNTVATILEDKEAVFLSSIGCSSQELFDFVEDSICLLYTSPSPRDRQKSRMPSSA